MANPAAPIVTPARPITRPTMPNTWALEAPSLASIAASCACSADDCAPLTAPSISRTVGSACGKCRSVADSTLLNLPGPDSNVSSTGFPSIAPKNRAV